MAPKAKTLLKAAKAKKKKETLLNDADDFLAAAVDNEDAMGKHRGGDGPKALRFARRALDLYSQGLQAYPKNFDLAYNRSRLLLEMATHPILVQSLDIPRLEVLQQALTDHEYALALDSENADLLFNTAQVLTTIAELTAKDSTPTRDAYANLEKALESLQKCFAIQEVNFSESRRFREEAALRAAEDDEVDGGAKLESQTTTAYEDSENEQWVSVVEPVTAETLLDTILAELGVLTTLCSLLSANVSSNSPPQSNVSIEWIENFSAKITSSILPELQEADESLLNRNPEIVLAKSELTSHMLELAFRSSAIDDQKYKELLDIAYAEQGGLSDHQLSHGQALISFNAALADSVPPEGTPNYASIRWNALSKAQRELTLAQFSTDNTITAKTHLLRGDVSLLLLALGHPPTSFPQAQSNSAQLLKNAEVFYRNAAKLFGMNQDQPEQDTAKLRAGVVQLLQASNSATSIADPSTHLKQAVTGKPQTWIEEELQDMIDEGLVQSSLFATVL